MKEKFDKILNEHGIYGEDAEKILYAVSDILKFVAEETKKKEPYARNSIERLQIAAYEVSALTADL